RRHVRPVEGTLDIAISAAVHRATAGGIAGYVIDRVDLHGTSAEVTATLRNRREEHRTVLALHATSAGPFSPVTWELEPIHLPILTVSPLTGTDSLLLNGQQFEIPEVLFSERGANRIGVVLHVLPGSYAIELPPPQPPLTSRPRVIYVPPVLGQWQTGMIDIDYGLSLPAEAREICDPQRDRAVHREHLPAAGGMPDRGGPAGGDGRLLERDPAARDRLCEHAGGQLQVPR
ncbi:MAG: hypothetical protein ACTIJK_06305, partial [Brachybacterium sp.]